MRKNNLILRLQNGEERAFKELVNLYSDPLLGYALSLSGDHHTANDIVQEVFISVFEYRKKLNPKYSIEGFLYKSTYNKFIDTYYKIKSRSKLHEQYINLLNQLVNRPVQENNSKLTKMKEEIEKLPKKIKEIFVMSKSDGLTNLEISSHLGISIKTVESNITKAYKILKRKIES
tara:strand:- start:62 stop:586 length:525 start_codon:yes stop_codon:yes gene_type:complete